MSELTFFEKIENIQTTLVAKKSQFNKFGNYNYRSVEDIMESVKPLLKVHKLIITITDSVKIVGDRFYIEAVVTITDGVASLSTTGIAREPLNQKGMNESQITGSASSYARKYALNGLLAIDDVKDMDTIQERVREVAEVTGKIISNEQRGVLAKLIQDSNTDLVKFNGSFGIKTLAELQTNQYEKAVALLNSKINKKKKNENSN